MGLTDAGRLYLEQVRTAFGLLDDAERDVLAQDGALAGRVRLSVPTTYGHYRLPPVLARFAQQYPQVQMELNITNRNVDLVAEGFDRPSAWASCRTAGWWGESWKMRLWCWWPRRSTCSAAARRRRWTTCSSTCACRS